MHAHYFFAKTYKIVVISQDTRPVGQTFKVSGKVEARRIAKAHNAICWNF
jgi:hypothetical protein